MSDWRKIDYRPIEEDKPSEWEDVKYGLGSILLFGVLVVSVAVSLFYVWQFLSKLFG